MKLHELHTANHIVKQLLEELTVGQGSMVQRVQSMIAQTGGGEPLKRQVVATISAETGQSETEVEDDIDDFLIGQGMSLWFRAPDPEPYTGPTAADRVRERDEQQQREEEAAAAAEAAALQGPGDDELDGDLSQQQELAEPETWESAWLRLYRDAREDPSTPDYSVYDYFNDANTARIFPPAQGYRVFEISDYAILGSYRVRNAEGEEMGGLGSYIVRTHAHIDIPQFGIKSGEHATKWVPKLVRANIKAARKIAKQGRSPDQPKHAFRNAIRQSGLGLFARRDKVTTEVWPIAFQEAGETTFDELSTVWENFLPPHFRTIIETIAFALLTT